MQSYGCNHCGISTPSIFEIMLHIFTDHLHQDIGLDKEEGKEHLKGMAGYKCEVLTEQGVN